MDVCHTKELPCNYYICNVKKIAAILLCSVYLLTSAGLAINIHYCNGAVKSIDFLGTQKDECCDTDPVDNGDKCCKPVAKQKSCCEKPAPFGEPMACAAPVDEKMGCCEDELVLVQIDEQQQKTQTFRIAIPSSSVAFLLSQFSSFETVENFETPFENQDLPPPKQRPLWLLNCTFTFYG